MYWPLIAFLCQLCVILTLCCLWVVVAEGMAEALEMEAVARGAREMEALATEALERGALAKEMALGMAAGTMVVSEIPA